MSDLTPFADGTAAQSDAKKKHRNRALHIKNFKRAQAVALSTSPNGRKANDEPPEYLPNADIGGYFASPPLYSPAKGLIAAPKLNDSASLSKLDETPPRVLESTSWLTKRVDNLEAELAKEKARRVEAEAALAKERTERSQENLKRDTEAVSDARVEVESRTTLEAKIKRLETEPADRSLSNTGPSTNANATKTHVTIGVKPKAPETRISKDKKLAQSRGDHCLALIRSNRRLRAKLNEIQVNLRPISKRDSVRILLLTEILAEYEGYSRMDRELRTKIEGL
ncbi:hypothetical protein PRZ48_003075 [Zasmidium cellare]|uniref:Uncharacterized protein n=1 Tax=Zasmidium cellare TaxID=395010 RepID=A0ABR0EU22_ZASCE|nr:hypothetical protein PRZ48_003075 [Zasmidium cellare]